MVRGTQVLDHTIQRDDLDTSTVGNAVIAKIIQGSGITLSSTGADSGTGDVTVSAGSGAIPSTVTPLMDSTAALGVDTGFARGDHVHPSDTSRLMKSGDTMTGYLNINMAYPRQVNCAAATGQDAEYWFATGGSTNPAVDYNKDALVLYKNYNDDHFYCASHNAAGAGVWSGTLLDSHHGAVSTDAGNIAQQGTDGLVLVPQSQIWSVRLRSFNALGNSSFECDQRNVGNVVTNPGAGVLIVDRWFKGGSGTYTVNCRQSNPSILAGIPYPTVPGTSYRISNNWFRTLLTAQETSLAASDHLTIRQYMEGIQIREIIGDVFSVSLLVYSTVAPLKFGVSLVDNGSTYSIVQLATVTTANVWQLIQLPNWPSMASSPSTNFNTAPGTVGAALGVCLAAGSTLTAPANGNYVSGVYMGAAGQDNFCSKPITTSEFEIGFVQMEPGPNCTALMDLPFSGPSGNLEACQRYYQKTYSYPTAPATATGAGQRNIINPTAASNGFPIMDGIFKRTMAKVPTVTIYNATTGAANSCRQAIANTDFTVSAVQVIGDSGFSNLQLSTAFPANAYGFAHYVADTGW